jgi:hypothetical protein
VVAPAGSTPETRQKSRSKKSESGVHAVVLFVVLFVFVFLWFVSTMESQNFASTITPPAEDHDA